MSDELTTTEVVAQAQETVTETAQAAVTADPVESQARDQGWVSKEEWVSSGREAEDWKPAKEFVRTGELYKSIHQTKRELKQTQAALDALAQHHKMVYDRAFQDAVKELKMEKRQAIRSGDFETVELVEDKMEALNQKRVQETQQLVQVAQRQAQVGPPPEYQEFINKNPWYLNDPQLRREADKEAFSYLNHDGGDTSTLLPHVERVIKQKYPEKFGVKRAAPNAVAPSQRSAKAAGDDVSLSEAEREIMRTFVRQGVMTEAQYKADLKKAKERS
jgi:hypothetical protein